MTHSRFRFAALFTLLLPLAQLPALAETALERAVGVQVSRALQTTAALGVHIVELDTGETVYGYSPDEPRVIASNNKLFTTAAALDALGPGYLFETRFLMRGRVDSGGVLQRGPGSGGLGRSADLGARVRRRSFRRVPALGGGAARARHPADHRATSIWPMACFEPLVIHPDWPRDQLTEWYEAPVDALSFSDNCILVRVWPAEQGGPAGAWSRPCRRCRSSAVDNTATTQSGKRRATSSTCGRTGGTLLTVRGSIDVELRAASRPG